MFGLFIFLLLLAAGLSWWRLTDNVASHRIFSVSQQSEPKGQLSEELYSKVQSDIRALIGEANRNQMETEEPAPKKRRRLQSDSDDESEEDCRVKKPEDEMTRYLSMPVKMDGREESICQWWSEVGKPLFPRLAKVARAVLALQASSTASEREFSAAGLTVSFWKRTS